MDKPCLKILDSTEHVDVSGGVLLDHVLDVVRLERLLEPSSCDKELDLAKCSNGILMSRRQLRRHVRFLRVIFNVNTLPFARWQHRYLHIKTHFKN